MLGNLPSAGTGLRRNNLADIADLFQDVNEDCSVERNMVLGLGVL